MSRSLPALVVVLAGLIPAATAVPAHAQRPADILALQRGGLSTNAGALGSDFPRQYVHAYRFAPPPVVVVVSPGVVHPWRPVSCGPSSTLSIGVDAGPVTLGGTWTTLGGISSVRCPAPGFPTTSITTTTITTTTVETSGGVVLAPALGPEPPPVGPSPTRP